MERLTDTVLIPLTTFKRCQICGFVSDDICEFRMLVECDDLDHPEENKILIRCRSNECVEVVAKHERLYIEVPWGQGSPGIFMLLCGDCHYRKETKCLHPSLKANGGSGLELKRSNTVSVRICYVDGRSGTWPSPFIECKGYEKI